MASRQDELRDLLANVEAVLAANREAALALASPLIGLFRHIPEANKLAALTALWDDLGDTAEKLLVRAAVSEIPRTQQPDLRAMLEKVDRARLLAAGDLLPDPLPPFLFRGVSGDGDPRGVSWTDDYSTASWFAVRLGEAQGCPRVVQTRLRAEHIAYYTQARMEFEYGLLLPEDHPVEEVERIRPMRALRHVIEYEARQKRLGLVRNV